MKFKVLVLALLAGLLGGLLGSALFAKPDTAVSKESAFERVLRTGTLRCAYYDWMPYVSKDPNTGKMTGVWYDYTEQLAASLGWKVTWQTVGLAEIGLALDSGRIDAHCGGIWITNQRLKSMDFARPISFQPILAYVRFDDNRFKNVADLNKADVRFSVIDGEGGATLVPLRFPLAKVASLPQMSTAAEMFDQVTTGKADVLVTNPTSMQTYLKSNPNTLKPMSLEPLSVFSEALAVSLNEPKLRQALDHATESMLNSGEVETIFKKYEDTSKIFWRVSPSYQKPE